MQAKLILRALSFLSLIVCIFMIPCIVIALALREYHVFKAFAISWIVLAAPAGVFIKLLRPNRTENLSARNSFLLVFVAWVGIAVFSALPFYLSGTIGSPANAFFEAASGISTTGATIVGNIESLPGSIILWRSICHWMGGMGVIMLTVALLPLLGIGGLQLVQAEQHGVDSAKLTSRIAQTAKYLWIIYTCFTLTCFILLKVGGMSTFDSVNHAFSSIATGGFSTKNDSIGHFDSPYLQWVIVGSMLAGGCSFVMYFQLFTGRIRKILKNTELKVYLLLVLSAGAIVTFFNQRDLIYPDLTTSIRHSVFHVVSIITTTGFAISDYTIWPQICQFVLFVLLITGGCAGSTAGGVKIARIVIIFKQAIIELKHLVHPRGVFMLRFNGNTINKEVVYSVTGFIMLYLFTVIMVAGVAASSGANLVTAFSTGLAMVGNTGLGLGNVGPVGTYEFYPEYVKFVLGMAMLIGRLELYTFYVLLIPFIWRK